MMAWVHHMQGPRLSRSETTTLVQWSLFAQCMQLGWRAQRACRCQEQPAVGSLVAGTWKQKLNSLESCKTRLNWRGKTLIEHLWDLIKICVIAALHCRAGASMVNVPCHASMK